MRVEEVGEKAEAGSTEPYFCRLSDDQTYLVKGRAALVRGLVIEVVCATLGRSFGIPIPDVAIAIIDGNLLTFNPEARASLGAGMGFASKFASNLTDITHNRLDLVSKNEMKRLFIFDYWIMNMDRTGTVYGGNSNLFYDVISKKLVVVDHNLAFDRKFEIDNFRNLHIGRDAWFDSARDMLDRDRYSADMEAAMMGVDKMEGLIPEAWQAEEPELLSEISIALARFRGSAFWDALV